MNKKGEFVTLATFFIVGILMLGILVYEKATEDKRFIGDKINKIVYYLDSNNPECNLTDIKINRDNLILFSSLEEAKNMGFTPSDKCF